jgi:TolB-like protein/uncharacterized protein HemY
LYAGLIGSHIGGDLNWTIVVPELIRRLLNRKVIQWGLGYLAGAWAVLQVIDFVGDQFGWPAQVSRIAMALLAIGFLVVAVLAWYHGDQGRQRVTVPETIMIGSLLIVAVAAVALASRPFGEQATPAVAALPRIEPRSLAVLPFDNVGGDPSDEYFSDGVTEEILNTVARLPGLRVASRTSSFSFKQQNMAIDEIAQRLKVAHVLEGSVRRFEQKVVISAQLIDAQTDRRVWSQDFDRDLSDVYAVQQEIAGAIARALELRLGDGFRASRPTLNSRAHDAYLLGLSQWHSRTRRGVAQSIAHFEEAIREDSLYAKAWAGLALAHSIHPIYDFRVNTLESARLTVQAGQRALALDSTLSEAHSAMGQSLSRYEWKWQQGVEELRRAIAVNPNDALARGYLSNALATQGHFTEAHEHANRAAELDPLSVYVHMIRAVVLYMSGNTAAALAELRLVRSIEPDAPTGLNYASRAFLRTEQYDSAAAMLHRLAELDRYPRPDETRQFIEALRTGRLDQARSIVVDWEKAGPFPAYTLAIFHGLTRDREAAIRMLMRSFDRRDALIVWLGFDPDMAALRDDPRVITILRRMGLR